MKTCSIKGCNNVHEGKGYCKKHYRSFIKYGDPLQTEKNKKLREYNKKQKELERMNRTKKLSSREGYCSVDGCGNPIKAKRLCEMHYARHLRHNETDQNVIVRKRHGSRKSKCLALGCNKDVSGYNFCNTHKSRVKLLGTPFIPKCGLIDCDKKEFNKGLCKEHYYEWMTYLREYAPKRIAKRLVPETFVD